MAFIKCGECRKKISDKAQACPQCGAPVVKGAAPPKKKTGLVTWIVATLFGFWVIFMFYAYREVEKNKIATQPLPVRASWLTASSDQKLQKERSSFIDKLIRLGVFEKIETASGFCYAWTGSSFDALSFDDKSRFLSVVYAYCLSSDAKGNIVLINDSRSGKQVGVYSEVKGGLKMD